MEGQPMVPDQNLVDRFDRNRLSSRVSSHIPVI